MGVIAPGFALSLGSRWLLAEWAKILGGVTHDRLDASRDRADRSPARRISVSLHVLQPHHPQAPASDGDRDWGRRDASTRAYLPVYGLWLRPWPLRDRRATGDQRRRNSEHGSSDRNASSGG